MNTYKIKELDYYKKILENIKNKEYDLSAGNTLVLLHRLQYDLDHTGDNLKSCTDYCPYSKLISCSYCAIGQYKCEVLNKDYFLVLFDNENKKAFNNCPYIELKEQIKELIKTIEK